jgi:Skp family chaperone for outer membrane proteins
MKKSLVIALAVAGSAGLAGVSRLSAERSAAPQNGIAVVDMKTVFRNSSRIQQAKEEFAKQLQAKQESFKKDGERGNQMVEKARTLPSGSPERKKLEQEIMKLDADLKYEGKRADREFREKESMVYFGLLRDVREELGRYAQGNRLQLVLGVDPPADLSDPQAVMQEVSKAIVYHRSTDITAAVSEAVNRRGASTAPTSKAATQGAAPRGAPR